MQEKVTFTPPEIKLFEGKTPPASWFNENVVRYLQVKSQAEFLTNFLAYAKQLQGEKVSKAIPQAVAEPELVEVPDKASADDISNILTFNALQPNIKAEIESLEKLVVILQQADPKLVKELNQVLIQLKMIAKGFPALTKEQLSFLTKTTKQMDDSAKKLPLSSQKKYWEKEFNMLYEIWENIDQFIKSSQSEMNQVKQNISLLEQLKSDLQALTGLFVKKGGQNFTKSEIQQLLGFLQAAINGFSKLSDKEQMALQGFLQTLGQIKGSNGKSLSGVTADAILKQWIEDQLRAHPDANPAQMKKYIQNLLDESDLGKTELPYLREMAQMMKEKLAQAQFPFVSGTSGVAFSKDQNGKIVINPNFDKEIEKIFILDPNATKTLQGPQKEVEIQLKSALERQSKALDGYQKATAIGENLKGSIGRAGATAAGNSNMSGSLPNDFKNAILGHYMPMQETYLMELAELLYFANFGAEMGNALLNKILDFSEAANNYDFAEFLHQDASGNYTGSATDAQNELSNERNQAQTDMNKTQSAINYINSEINRINNNPQLTKAQKAKMINQLEGYKQNLQAAYTQLQQLYNLIKNVSVTKIDDNHFKLNNVPSDFQTQLGDDEKLVINGNPNPPPGGATGGLLNIQSDIQADQQAYSDQSQNQQMMLQMRMTEIQQEWTVVSDSLQALNQMYMTCAQAIYK